MEKLRNMMGTGSLLLMIFLIGTILVYFFPEHATIATIASVAISFGIFHVIDKMADLKVLEKTTAQQSAFNKEFEYFKTMYANQLESMPCLYPIIDLAQSNTLDMCRRYPDKYKDEKDFKKTTVIIILSLFDGYIHAHPYRREPSAEQIKKFMEEIRRRERLS